MVCFCDIPLKFISENHTERYGHFGLGLNKDWGLKNKINPITYRTEGSPIDKSFHDLLIQIGLSSEELIRLKEFQSDTNGMYETGIDRMTHSNSVATSCAINLAAFFKSYLDINSGNARNNYVDREWRWVPDEAEKTFCLSNEEEMRKRMNSDYHRGTPAYLNFEINDLKHLIVKTRSDTEQVIKLIRSSVLLDLNENEKDNLIQKIIDIESINLDM